MRERTALAMNTYAYVGGDPLRLIWATIRVQRPEWYNVLKLWFNRWTMQIGNGMDPTVAAASPKAYTRRIVTPQWFESPSDPRVCTASTGAGPREGGERPITQLYIHGPDASAMGGHPYSWHPFVPSPTEPSVPEILHGP